MYDKIFKAIRKHSRTPLKISHSPYYTQLLDEYQSRSSEIFYYGLVSIRQARDNTYYGILAGVEDNYDVISKGEKKKQEEEFFKLIDIYRLKNIEACAEEINDLSNDKEMFYFPVLVFEKEIYFLFAKKTDIYEIYKVNKVQEFYFKFPLFFYLARLRGIKYILPLDPQQRKMEICTGYFVLEEQENDEKYKAMDSYFSDSGLPYISTIHEISNWNYEGDENRGSIDLFIDSKVQVQYDICFEESLFLGQTSARMIRKYLQMTNKNFSLKYCSNKEYISGFFSGDAYWTADGIGKRQSGQGILNLDFLGENKWKLSSEYESISCLGGKYSIQKNDNIEIENSKISKKIECLYKEMQCEKDCFKIIKILNYMKKQKHGTMLVVSMDAKAEVKRLCECGRGIEIKKINFYDMICTDEANTQDIIQRITSIDGAVVCDLAGNCYGLGVIVDGRAYNPNTNTAYGRNKNIGRGARYNSSVTYVEDCKERGIKCLCVVISEDGTVDVVSNSD